MTGLPNGWTTATLEELSGTDGLVTDGDWIESKDQDPAGDIRLIQLMDVGDGRFTNRSSRFLNDDTARRLRCTKLSVGDVLIARMPDPLGRACVFPGVGQEAVTAVDVLIWRAGKNGAVAEWLKYAVNSPEVRQQLALQAGGTTRQRVAGGVIKRLVLPVPPLAEQRLIVSKLDALTSRTARARAELDRIPALSFRYKQTVLEKAFAGELFTDGRAGWKSITLGELGRWGSGGTPKSGRTEYYGGDIPWVRSGDLEDGPITRHAVTITDAGLANSSAKWIPGGTVLLAMYGATIGRVGLTTYPVTTNQAVAALQCERSLITPEFAFWLLRSLKPAFVGAGQGGAQPNISQTIIKSWPVLVPSLEEQEQIVRGLEWAFSDIERLTSEAAAASRLLDRMDQAVLAQAFRGELVPQDGDHEPASVLLDRVRAERGGMPKARRKFSPATPASRKKSDMPKSRLDDDVKHQPFLASILRASGTALSADSLFETADLPITDFYKQLAWEIDNGLVKERAGTLEAA